VFNDLSSQLDRQLSAMRGTFIVVLPAINATLKTAGLPAIVPSTDEIRTPPNRAPAGNGSDDDEGRN
jgi:hypothetical protein